MAWSRLPVAGILEVTSLRAIDIELIDEDGTVRPPSFAIAKETLNTFSPSLMKIIFTHFCFKS